MEIQRYKLVQEENGSFVLVIYLDPQLNEFAREFGQGPRNNKALKEQIGDLIKKELPHVKVVAAKVMAGTILVTTLYFSGGAFASAAGTDSDPSIQQVYKNDVYTVQPGDTLFGISKKLNVTIPTIMEMNGLQSNTIYVGQSLKLPFFTYEVVAGDTLFLIGKRFNTNFEEIRSLNQLSSDSLSIGQRLKIPLAAAQQTPNQPVSNPEQGQTSTENDPIKYTVVSGDTLSLIAKKNGTTVEEIRSLNELTSDLIFVGQSLLLPISASDSGDSGSEAPTETVTNPAVPTETVPVSETPSDSNPVPDPSIVTTTYTVVSGDTLWSIANRFNVTVATLKSANNLTTDTIRLGQNLVIPTKVSVDNEAPSAPSITPISPISAATQANVNVSGSTEANANIEIEVTDGTSPSKTYKVKANADGSFQTAVDTTGLNDGPISFIVTATDNEGNKSTESRVSATKDTTINPPTIAVPEVINSGNNQDFLANGTAKPGATIIVTASDGVSSPIRSEVMVNETGEYQMNLDLSSLNDGMIKVNVKAIDAYGNESKTTEASIIKDTSTSVPFLNIEKQVTNQNVDAYQIIGAAEPGAEIEFTVSDGVNPDIVSTAKVNEQGEFHQTIDLRTLNEGELTIVTRALDKFGNRSESQEITIIKETSIEAPSLESAELINQQNQQNYFIHGVARPGATIDIVVSDGTNQDVLASTISNANGEYYLNVDLSSLDDTDLLITAMQTNKAGVTSETSQVTIAKDTTAPEAPVLHNNHVINSQNQGIYVLSGLAEKHANIEVMITNANGQKLSANAQANEDGEYKINVDLTSFNEGDLIVELTQQDAAGNSSQVMKKTLMKDTVAPNKITLDSLAPIYSGNLGNYMISGTTEPNSIVEFSLTDGVTNLNYSVTADGQGRFEVPINADQLRDGNLELSIIATDTAGNEREPYVETVMKDTTGPTEVTVSPLPYVNGNNSKEFTIDGSSVEEGAHVSVSITDGERTVTKTTEVKNGAFTTTMDLSILKDGPLTLQLTQTDQAGNSGIAQVSTIEKDTVVETPIVSKNGFSTRNQQYIYSVVGTAEENATVEVAIRNQSNQVVKQTTTADSKGFYMLEVELDRTNAIDALDVSVTQTDVAGNISEATPVDFATHTILEGESLYSIAKRYNTTVEALRSLNQLTSDVIQPNQTLRLPVTASEVINLGYMYFGNTKEYANTVNKTGHSMNIVSPSYFDINSDGTLKLTYQVDPSFVETMHQQGVRVVPFLSNHWDREVGRAMLANKELAAKQIADAIERYNLDGVNVDIENVTDVDRDNYTEFVRLLRELVPEHKEVSVAVAANPNGWTQGWHGSYDYTSLAKYADYLMIMSYDESYLGGEAGPVASADWVEKSIQYALDQGVPNEKVVLGIAHYGRYWMEGTSYGGFGISNRQVEEMLKTYEGTVVFDEASKSPKAIITIEKGDPVMIVGGTSLSPGTYEIWFENEESIRYKLSLVGEYNIKGVGNWSVGQEDPSVWNSYTTSLPNTVPVTTTPPKQEAQPTYTNYRVVAGDNLWLIANRNHTTINTIKELNQLSSDMLSIGQILKIPLANEPEPVNEGIPDPVPEQQVPAENTGTDEPMVEEAIDETINTTNPETETITQTTYSVVSGDTLSAIAKRFDTTVTAIKQENNLATDMIYIGQTLTIPAQGSVEKSETTVPEPVKEPIKYTVVSGDSLSVIANRYNTTVTAIKEANNLTKDIIYIGQTLVIP